MIKTTYDPNLLKTLVCIERQQQDNIPEDLLTRRNINLRDTAWSSPETGYSYPRT